jgi:hypothetical protein
MMVIMHEGGIDVSPVMVQCSGDDGDDAVQLLALVF